MTSSQQAPEWPLFNFAARAVSIYLTPKKGKMSGGKKEEQACRNTSEGRLTAMNTHIGATTPWTFSALCSVGKLI